jgi:hypothetical protein
LFSGLGEFRELTQIDGWSDFFNKNLAGGKKEVTLTTYVFRIRFIVFSLNTCVMRKLPRDRTVWFRGNQAGRYGKDPARYGLLPMRVSI